MDAWIQEWADSLCCGVNTASGNTHRNKHLKAHRCKIEKNDSMGTVMYGCEFWTIKKPECWRMDAFKLWCWRGFLRVPWTARRSTLSILKENRPWIFIGRTDAKAEASVLWPSDVKSWLIGKDPDAGKDWKQEEKGTTEDDMVGWHHQFSGHEFEQTLGDGEGQGSLVCCCPWSGKELDTT